MGSWYVMLSGDWTAQEEFEAIFMLHGGPENAAMFAKRNVVTRAMDFYFTPLAAEIASGLMERYQAVPCDAPPYPNIHSDDLSGRLLGLALLVGDQRIIERSGWQF